MGAGSFAVNTAFGAKDKVSPVFSKMISGAGKFENRLSRLNASAQGFGTCIEGMVKKIGAVMGAVFAFQKVKEKINEATNAAEQEIEAQEKLTQILKNNASIRARGANEYLKVSQELFNMASDIQQKGVIGDEVLVGGMQALGSMGFDDKVIKKIMPLIADLAVQQKGYNVTIQDTENLAKGLGRALAGNTGYLSRMGVVLSKNQIKSVQNMNAMQRANFLYDLLSKRVGGLNEKLAQTERGIKIQYLNNLSDRLEDIGKKIIPIEGRIFRMLNAQIPTLSVLIDKFFDGVEYGLKAVEPLGAKFSILFDYLGQSVLPGIAASTPGLKNLFEGVLIPSIGFLIDGITFLTKVLVGTFGIISNICSFLADYFVPILTSVATILGGVLIYNINSVAWGLLGLFIRVQAVSVAFLNNFAWGALGAALKLQMLGKAVLAFCASPLGLITLGIVGLITVVTLLWKNWDKVTEVVSNWWNNAKTALNGFWEKCKEVFGKVGLFFKNNFVNILLSALGPIGWMIMGIRKIADTVDGIKKKNNKNDAKMPDYRSTINDRPADAKYYSSNMSGALEVKTTIENQTPFSASTSIGIIKENNLTLSPAN